MYPILWWVATGAFAIISGESKLPSPFQERPVLTTRLASIADVPAVQALCQMQTARFHRADPRLPDQVILSSWWILPQDGACWLARADGALLGVVIAEAEHWTADSPYASVFPRRYLRLQLALADQADPAAILPLLLARAAPDQLMRATGAPSSRPGLMVMTPACDAALSAVLTAEGFTPYHTIAHQPLPEALPTPPPVPARVRPAEWSDTNAVADLMVESWQFHALHQPAIELSPLIREGCRCQASQLLGDGYNQLLLVAEHGDEIIGFFAIGLSSQDPLTRPALFLRGQYGDIYEVGVRGDWRGRGIGTALYHAAWRWFTDRGVGAMFVNYAPTNPLSSRFWPGLGFVDAWINWWRP